jgi:hypothetical protein
MRNRETQASAGQRLLWLLSQYHGLPESLNCPLVCRITGPLDVGLLQDTVNLLISRHEALRTTFFRRGRLLRQLVHASSAPPIRFLRMSDQSDPMETTQEALKQELRTPIDAANCPVRVTLWRLASDTHVLCFNMHHLVTDTTSCLILQRELAACYGAGRHAPAIPQVGWQYSQFTAWQERQLAGHGFERHRRYWQHQLVGVAAPALPIGPPQPGSTMIRANIQRILPADCVADLQALAASEHSTLFGVMLAIYYVVLMELTKENDLAVASLFANRTRSNVQYTVGFLTNMLVLRTRCRSTESFAELVRRVRITVREATIYQELPYHLVTRTIGARRLDEIVFQMLSESLETTTAAGDVYFTGVVPDVIGRFTLELALMARGQEIAVKLYYTDGRVTPAWAKSFIDDYVRIATCLAAAPTRPIEAAIDGTRRVD